MKFQASQSICHLLYENKFSINETYHISSARWNTSIDRTWSERLRMKTPVHFIQIIPRYFCSNYVCLKISCLHVVPRFVRALILFGKDNELIEECDVMILQMDIIVTLVTLFLGTFYPNHTNKVQASNQERNNIARTSTTINLLLNIESSVDYSIPFIMKLLSIRISSV